MDSTLNITVERVFGLKPKHLRLLVRFHFRNQTIESTSFENDQQTDINLQQDLPAFQLNQKPIDCEDYLFIELIKYSLIGTKKIYGQAKCELKQLQSESSTQIKIQLKDTDENLNGIWLHSIVEIKNNLKSYQSTPMDQNSNEIKSDQLSIEIDQHNGHLNGAESIEMRESNNNQIQLNVPGTAVPTMNESNNKLISNQIDTSTSPAADTAINRVETADEIICESILLNEYQREQNLLLETESLHNQHLQLNVSIFEAVEICALGTDVYVQCQLNDTIKSTKNKQATGEMYFNEYFTFDIRSPLELLSSYVLIIRARESRTLKSDKIFGECQIDLSTIWLEPNHSFVNKWAPLLDLEDATSGLIRGYIKLNLSLVGASTTFNGTSFLLNKLHFSKIQHLNKLKSIGNNINNNNKNNNNDNEMTTNNDVNGETNETYHDHELNQNNMNQMTANDFDMHDQRSMLTPTSKMNFGLNANMYQDSIESDEQSVMQLVVNVYRADGLPSELNVDHEEPMTGNRTNDTNGLFGKKKSNKSSLGCETSTYVKVTYGSRESRTSTCKRTCTPVWNEAVCFVDWYPFLCKQIRLELFDAKSDKLLAARCLNLDHLHATDQSYVSSFETYQNQSPNDQQEQTFKTDLMNTLQMSANDFEQTWLPSFGPGYLHFYAPAMINERSTELVWKGIEPGNIYMGRLLISIHCETIDTYNSISTQSQPIVYNRSIRSLRPQSFPPPMQHFTTIVGIYGSERISSKWQGKQIAYELTIGNMMSPQLDEYTAIESTGESMIEAITSESDGTDLNDSPVMFKDMNPNVTAAMLPSHFICSNYKAIDTNDQHLHLNLLKEKPLLYVHTLWPDYQQRDYLLNALDHLINHLQFGMEDIDLMQQQQHPNLIPRIRGLLKQLCNDCDAYFDTIVKNDLNKNDQFKQSINSRLEKQKRISCLIQLKQFQQQMKQQLKCVEQINLNLIMTTLENQLNALQTLTNHPEDGTGDMIIWQLCQGKRVGHVRLRTRQYMYNERINQSGIYCGRLHSIHLHDASKHTHEPCNALQLIIYHVRTDQMWQIMSKLPLVSHEWIKQSMNNNPSMLPEALPLSSQHVMQFELRTYLYQARALPAADSNGLSDPFARIQLAGHCVQSKTCNDTLNPIWDQQLMIKSLLLTMDRNQLDICPPLITVEVYDADMFGKEEFLGRCFTCPDHICLVGDNRQAPKLRWINLQRDQECTGQILIAFELLQLDANGSNCWHMSEERQALNAVGNDQIEIGTILSIPRLIRPKMIIYRLQVVFWGVRDLRRLSQLINIDRPAAEIEIAGQMLRSNVIQSYKKHCNFNNTVREMDVQLPEQCVYCPPLTIRVMDCKSFGRSTLLGCHSTNMLNNYMNRKAFILNTNQHSTIEINIKPETYMYAMANSRKAFICSNVNNANNNNNKNGSENQLNQKMNIKQMLESIKRTEDKLNEFDWWTRYFASKQSKTINQSNNRNSNENSPKSMQNQLINSITLFRNDSQSSKKSSKSNELSNRLNDVPNYLLINILPGPLEESDLYSPADWMNEFELLRGKSTIMNKRKKNMLTELFDENCTSGRFIGCINIQPMPQLNNSLIDSIPKNDAIHFLLRVYIIKANNLQPKDNLTGKADPFVTMQLSSGTKVSDKSNYISNHLNPTFGRCFELKGQLPLDSMLTIQIKDYDYIGKNELIGETKINLENRYYSKSMSLIGLPKIYLKTGINKWRLPEKPQTILIKLCKQYRMPMTIGHNHVRIGHITFTFKSNQIGDQLNQSNVVDTNKSNDQVIIEIDDNTLDKQQMCLAVLNNWYKAFGYKLCPEHVETRSLYHPNRPAVPQGTLELFIDIIPIETYVPQHCLPVNVAPHLPKSYELRVIIYNTEDVPLDEINPVTNEASSDIYVKGWIGQTETAQSTDIHYRSLTGEGNFNWRFIFEFDYLSDEACIVLQEKNIFSINNGEQKLPARLQLQVWDADFCSKDDFMGSINLDLNRIPRPAKSSVACDLKIMGINDNSKVNEDQQMQTINLFKQKRIKGWWPFMSKNLETGQTLMAGKLEAELHLLTSEEAKKYPVGKAREEPDALPKPKRPDTSFAWFLSPWKSFRYVIWKNHKFKILKLTIFILLTLFLVLFVYSVPGYTANKLINSL